MNCFSFQVLFILDNNIVACTICSGTDYRKSPIYLHIIRIILFYLSFLGQYLVFVIEFSNILYSYLPFINNINVGNVLINIDSTGKDGIANLVVNEPIGEVLGSIVDLG